jgi:hypothetical protein
MNPVEQLDQRRRQLVRELEELSVFRRGSISEQMVTTKDAEGRPRRRGPYPIYSFKEKGRTISRRLHDPQQVQQYRQQIQNGRRFQQVVNELLHVGEALGDRVLDQETVKKTPFTRSTRIRKFSAG